MALATVSESQLEDRLQTLSNYYTISTTEMVLKGTKLTKIFAGNHCVATKKVPKVGMSIYHLDVNLVNKLLEK